MSISIEIPIPDSALNPNSRAHWSKSVKPKRIQRGSTTLLILEQIGPKWIPWAEAKCDIEVTYSTKRTWDRDNLQSALKSAFDGAQDSGLFVNDKYLSFGPQKIAEPDKDNPHVKLTFTEV